MAVPNAPVMTPEKLAMMVELLPEVDSLRDLASILGVGLQTIRKASAPFIAIMKLRGELKPCACGKDKFHPYGCVGNYRATLGAPRQDRSFAAKRDRVIELAATGMLYREIAEAVGLSKATVTRHCRNFMTSEQRATRAAAVAVRPLPAGPERHFYSGRTM